MWAIYKQTKDKIKRLTSLSFMVFTHCPLNDETLPCLSLGKDNASFLLPCGLSESGYVALHLMRDRLSFHFQIHRN